MWTASSSKRTYLNIGLNVLFRQHAKVLFDDGILKWFYQYKNIETWT